ncbi:MAG: hypothetical protein U0984_12560 [Prosthecobacter sp.]|nr:hypothetical protein [Prosthecobacter sp.]
MQPPPIPNRDLEHLRLLAVFHYVVGGLSIACTGFLYVHFLFMRMIFADPKLWENAKEPPPFDPQEFFGFFVWFYVIFGAVAVAAGVLNLLSGRYLQKRKHRMFSMLVAGFDCLQVPLGTVLGVFTLVVLNRESMARVYAPPASNSSPPHHDLPQPQS